MRGKVGQTVRELLDVEDHPRVCGEKFYIVLPLYNLLGSPPRMRGKVSGEPLTSATARITPAYAGKRAAQAGRQP